MSNELTNSQLQLEMRLLLDNLTIWRWLHVPDTLWSGCYYTGKARAVDWRLSSKLKHWLFKRISIHQINTEGNWSYGHSHESSFVSFVISESYDSESWYPAPYHRFDERSETHQAGQIVPFAEVERFHSLRTQHAARTVVLWTEFVPKPVQALRDSPIVNVSRMPATQVSRNIGLARQDFFQIRQRMKKGL